MSESKEMWLTPRANEPENDTGFVERNGDRGAHCFGSLADQVRGTLPMWPTPAVNDMGESKTPEQWDAWTAAMKERHKNGNGHGPSLSIEARRGPTSTSLLAWAHGHYCSSCSPTFAPSDSLRWNPMPLRCLPITGPTSRNWEPFRGLPEIEYWSDVVRSQLSLLVRSLAKATVSPASASEEPTTATFGLNVSESLASYDPATHSLRTYQVSLLPMEDGSSTECLVTFPRSGMLVSGKLYQQPTWERPTGESASGSSALTSEQWYTPDVPNGGRAMPKDSTPTGATDKGKRQVGLHNQVAMERAGPPPLASGLLDPVKPSTSGSPAESWPSPRASDGSKATRTEQGARIEVERDKGPDLGAVVGARAGGKLNPSWVETLMGLPLGHTQLPTKFKKRKA